MTSIRTSLLIRMVPLALAVMPWQTAFAQTATTTTTTAPSAVEALKQEVQQQALLDLLQKQNQAQIDQQIAEGLLEEEEEQTTTVYKYKKTSRILKKADMPQRVFNNVPDLPTP